MRNHIMNPRTGLARLISSNLRQVPDMKVASTNADILETQSSLTDVELLEIGLSRLEEGKNFDLPISYCEKALNITSSPLIASECHYVIAVSSQQLKKDNQFVLDHFEQALRKCDEGKHLDQNEYIRIKSKIFRNLGLYYLPKNQFAETADYFKQSLELAKQSPTQLKGFIPAMTAYYALVLCKQDRYDEGFKLFEEAKSLYDQFSNNELNVSMDYASYYVHLGRIYIQQNEFEKAVEVLEKGRDLRIKNLQAETTTHAYAENRIGAALTLLKEAQTKLSEQKTLSKSVSTLLQTGNSLHTAPSDVIVSGAELSSPQKRKVLESSLGKGTYVFFDGETLACHATDLDFFETLVHDYCLPMTLKGTAADYIQQNQKKCVYGQLGTTDNNATLLNHLKLSLERTLKFAQQYNK